MRKEPKNKKKLEDIIWVKINRLTALYEVEGEYRRGNGTIRKFMYSCECGNQKILKLGDVSNGSTKSCGCLKLESCLSNLPPAKHNLTKSRIFEIWRGIKKRCFLKSHEAFDTYGGRGITICEELLNFENFACWAHGNGYEENLTIDRIDVNGNYEPSNCRWVTPAEQSRNKRKMSTNTSGYKGVGKHNTSSGMVFRAQWTDENGQLRSRSYSCNKYGEDVALQLAVAKRKEQIERLKQFGIFYNE